MLCTHVSQVPKMSLFNRLTWLVSAMVKWIKLMTPVQEGPGSKPVRVENYYVFSMESRITS